MCDIGSSRSHLVNAAMRLNNNYDCLRLLSVFSMTNWQCTRTTTGRAFLSTFGSSSQVSSLQSGLPDRTHVADGDCWKDKLLFPPHAHLHADWVAEIGLGQSSDANQHTSSHHGQRKDPITLFHRSYNALSSKAYTTIFVNILLVIISGQIRL